MFGVEVMVIYWWVGFQLGLAGNRNGWIHIIYVGAFRNYIYKYIMKQSQKSMKAPCVIYVNRPIQNKQPGNLAQNPTLQFTRKKMPKFRAESGLNSIRPSIRQTTRFIPNQINKKLITSTSDLHQGRLEIQRNNFLQETMSKNDKPRQPFVELYNDDEKLQRVERQQNKKQEVSICLKALRAQVKLGQSMVLPGMCSVMGKEGQRTSVDLICVIDVSASMSGPKIQLVKQTMRLLIKTLTPEDRLSIITFHAKGSRICPLKAVTQENLAVLSKLIDNIEIYSGTKIMKGMEIALKTIRDRRVQNKATSIFLLSDGQDKQAERGMRLALKEKENENLGVFTIHSFGFGKDHDEDLMNKISQLKDGSFYYIKELNTLDEAFCNALGAIISSVAKEAVITVKCVSKGIASGIKISKVYGDKWQKIAEGQYRIKLTQLVSDVSKDFIFELEIPEIKGFVNDIGRQHSVVELSLQAVGMSNQIISHRAELSLIFINSHEKIADKNEDVDVMQNYLRVKAAEAIQESMKKAENNQFKEAEEGINGMINKIKESLIVRPEKMVQLLKDLDMLKEKCKRGLYEAEGRKLMMSIGGSHCHQDNFRYSNLSQLTMMNLAKQYRFSI